MSYKQLIAGLIFLCFCKTSVGLSFTLNSSTNPSLKGWDDKEVQLFLNTTNCPSNIDLVSIISDASAVWNNVPTSTIKVSYGGTTTSTGYSSPPIIYCETNFASIGGSPDPNFVVGAASVLAPAGQITSGLIFLNATSGQARISNLKRETLVIVLAHEIGHLLGLGHSSSKNALMYYDASAKMQRNLSQDDIDGISYLYPSDELTGGPIAGCGRIENTKNKSDRFINLSLMITLTMFPLLLLGVFRRHSIRIVKKTI